MDTIFSQKSLGKLYVLFKNTSLWWIKDFALQIKWELFFCHWEGLVMKINEKKRKLKTSSYLKSMMFNTIAGLDSGTDFLPC